MMNSPHGLQMAAPFWMSLALAPIMGIAAAYGGWALLLPPLYALGLVSLLDRLTGLETSNADPDTPDRALFWHRLITLIWFPVQLAMQLGLLWWVTRDSALATWEKIALFHGVGIAAGAVGINYAHELMHQGNRLERWLGDLLMASVFYGHFRSEHLLVHHHHVGTPRDPVTARYNEGFHRFFPRVLGQCLLSAWRAERGKLAHRGCGPLHPANPFWRYGALQMAMLTAAWAIGGWPGIGLILFQAFIAVLYLELTNYVEHYGLTRKYLGDGKYEHVKPHHSWNADHRVSNWLLINLQRHSDHHYKPNRRFPLLQTYSRAEAPQLPYSYPIMTAAALIPPLYRRMMNPRVRAWRRQFYPEISDWPARKAGADPMPGKAAPLA